MRSVTIIIFSVILCISQTKAGHEWKEFGYYGGYVGIANMADDEDSYFIGAMAFYHNQLVHDHPLAWGKYVADWGVVGLASYYRNPESDLSITAQISKGLWLDRTALLQFSAGPSWSESYGFGGSSTALLSYAFSLSQDSINAMAIFLQSEAYLNEAMAGAVWRFSLGVSVGIGELNEISD